MSQVKRQDDLGTLTDFGSFIRLSDARVTVGGRQYKIAQLDQSYGTLADGQAYFVYVTAISQVPSLVIAQSAPLVPNKKVGTFTYSDDFGQTIQGAVGFKGGLKIYDESVVSVGWSSGTPNFESNQFLPYKDPLSGLWRLRFTVSSDLSGASSGTSFTLTVPGVTFLDAGATDNWGVDWNSSFSDPNNITAYADQGSNVIVILSAASKNWSTRHYLSGDIPLAGKPTWADEDNTFYIG